MRTDRLVPILVIAYYVAMLIFLTFPGYVPFSRIRPLVLGMPFALFWQVLWVSGAVVVLGGFFLWESRRTAANAGPGGARLNAQVHAVSGDASLPGSRAVRDPSSRPGGPASGNARRSESGGETSTTGRGFE